MPELCDERPHRKVWPFNELDKVAIGRDQSTCNSSSQIPCLGSHHQIAKVAGGHLPGADIEEGAHGSFRKRVSTEPTAWSRHCSRYRHDRGWQKRELVITECSAVWGEDVPYRMTLLNSGRVILTRDWKGTFAEARTFAKDLALSDTALRIEVRNKNGELLFYYPSAADEEK